jgi:hypothetical protein
VLVAVGPSQQCESQSFFTEGLLCGQVLADSRQQLDDAIELRYLDLANVLRSNLARPPTRRPITDAHAAKDLKNACIVKVI